MIHNGVPLAAACSLSPQRGERAGVRGAGRKAQTRGEPPHPDPLPLWGEGEGPHFFTRSFARHDTPMGMNRQSHNTSGGSHHVDVQDRT